MDLELGTFFKSHKAESLVRGGAGRGQRQKKESWRKPGGPWQLVCPVPGSQTDQITDAWSYSLSGFVFAVL